MTSSISDRKTEHLTLCASGPVAFRAKTTWFEQVHFVHEALPDLAEDDLDTSTTIFGAKLRAPLVIAAMTGGTERAREINHALAEIAEARGYAFALGSQRPILRASERDAREVLRSYRVRAVAPTIPVLGNLGVVQAGALETRAVHALCEAVGATAIAIHLNPAMEVVQPGGDRDFRGGLAAIARLRAELPIPVLVKETGCGLSRRTAERLHAVGIRHVDVSGAGGTSWVGVEALRAARGGDAAGSALGEALWDWGIPTAASVASLAPLGFDTLVATGGVQSGVDVARAIALGATAAGIARPVLAAFDRGGSAAVHAFFDRVEAELRAVMLLTGSRDLAALRMAPRVLGADLTRYLAAAART